MAEKKIIFFSSWLIYHLITVFSVCNGERRIIGGQVVTVKHKHMVYIIKAETSKKTYVGWVCGGSLVRKRLAITSAACVRDVQHMYIIAGYSHYIPDGERNSDKCISNMKRKIVNVCTPKDYNLVYAELNQWANLDIAVVKADADITGVEGYKDHCEYIPRAIGVNYELKLQDTGVDALIFGWGHAKEWRKDKDLTDFNQHKLNYGATKIYDKNKCLNKYQDFKIDTLIRKYMICTWPPSEYTDKIVQSNSDQEDEDGYHSSQEVEGCDEDADDDHPKKSVHNKIHGSEELENSQVGICQNDHGGPLISWSGPKIKVIGVASVFRVNTDRECEGPFLFTSTYCNMKFLKCVLIKLSQDTDMDTKNIMEDIASGKNRNKTHHDHTRRSLPYYCNLPPIERGFDIIERQISWLDHPDGPAETEKYQMRPQRPLQDYFRRSEKSKIIN